MLLTALSVIAVIAWLTFLLSYAIDTKNAWSLSFTGRVLFFAASVQALLVAAIAFKSSGYFGTVAVVLSLLSALSFIVALIDTRRKP